MRVASRFLSLVVIVLILFPACLYAQATAHSSLVEGAKKEGKLVWYTSLTIYKEMAKSFEARYPGVTV